MKPIHILMVISSFRPLIGGGEMQAERLATALGQRGHRVTVLTRHMDHRCPATEVVNGVEVVRVSGQTRWSYSARMIGWIRKNRRRIDVIHAHQANSPLMVGVLAGRLYGIPVLCTPMTLNPELSWLNGQGLNRFRRWIFASTDLWLAKSGEIAQSLDGFVPGRVLRIPNGVDTAMFAPRGTPPGKDLPTVLFVGRLEQPKRVDLLLRAWEQINGRARLLIVGDGSLRAEWEAMRSSLKLSHVEFVGNRSDVVSMLQLADIFVLASDLEGMPNALLEAMSCGLPCVASAVGAIPELLGDGAGILIPAGDSVAIATGLDQLLNDRVLCESLRAKARTRVMERYSLDSVAQRVENAYQRVLKMEG